jgi:class 3 adenylate cyclase
VNNGGACIGAASGVLGLLAATIERWDDAESHFKDAIALNERIGARPWVARVQLNYAEMLMERGAEGDRRRALELLQPALSTFEALGMKQWLEPALALKLSAQGVDLSSPGNSIDAVASLVYSEKPDLKKHAAPDGTVTIMFSDIEGSTAMADRLGDKRFMEVLREHNSIIRKQIKSHGGFEVKSEGDGFMVAFQSARKAVECAIAIQEALDARDGTVGAPLEEGGGAGGAAPGAGSGVEPVRVRIGLHAGEVIKEGEDFFGRNVIMAARVASQACGGEILVSSVLKALMEGSDVPWGASRTVELKGLSGEHEIWPVQWS